MTENKRLLRRITDKLYGGLKMSWLFVILYAVATAVLTTVFLVVPIFYRTSFMRMGETFEAWVFFAVIIMANCKTPLDSALKTFVFFLISQPLIYLFQVPFSDMGWGVFGYYRFWIVWTLLTFPMAFVGWFIRRKDWISLLILLPILYMLTSDYVGSFEFTFKHFPYLLVTALFCLGQVLLYLYVFTSNILQKLIGVFAPLAVVVIIMLATPQVSLGGNSFLPDEPVLSENAVVEVADTDLLTATISQTGKDSMIDFQANKYGSTTMTITDGDKEYHYTVRIYEDDDGHPQMEITPN